MKARKIAESGRRLKEELKAAGAAMFATTNPSVGGEEGSITKEETQREENPYNRSTLSHRIPGR
jgi:hypothetical protein